MSAGRWVAGDHFGRPIPADPATLRSAGSTYLTEVFRAAGVLTDHDAVTRITQFDEFPGGSTGRKVLLRVDYDGPVAGGPTELFVKFSRDFDNAIRDRGRTQMESEVLFASLSREPGFPITVPATLFADYHHGTGTGLLICQRIAYGDNGIERQYHKCLDYELPEPVQHYRALMTVLGRLVGSHRSGRIPADRFPVDMTAAQVGARAPISVETVNRRLGQLNELAAAGSELLPANIRSARFLSRLRQEVPEFLRAEPAVWDYLGRQPDYVALCHWNANVDNAWFWRDADGVLCCGLLDWGCAGRMNVAMALWGALSGSEVELWDHHLDELLTVFVSEIQRCGGPTLNVAALTEQIMLYVGVMTVAWLLDVPALIRSRFGDAAATLTRTHPLIKDDESVRAPIQMLTNALNLWETRQFGALLRATIG